MRIVVLNPFMQPGYSGPTVLMQRLFTEIASRPGNIVTALGPAAPDSPAQQIKYVVFSKLRLRTIRGQFGWWIKCSAWLLRNRGSYELVHMHGAYLYNLLPAVMLRILGCPYVVLPVAADADLKRNSRSNRFIGVRALKRRLISGALAGYALADENSVELRSMGLEPERVFRLDNPIASQFLLRAQEPNVEDHVIVFVGKLGARKRPELLLETLVELKLRGWENCRAVFVGPYESDAFARLFKGKSEDLNIQSSVEVCGFVTDVAEQLSKCHGIFVLLSRQEGLPGALTEAMALGMPSIVTAVGAMDEVVVRSASGFVTEPSASKVAELVHEIWSDPAHWRILSARARKFASAHYSVGVVADSYLMPLVKS